MIGMKQNTYVQKSLNKAVNHIFVLTFLTLDGLLATRTQKKFSVLTTAVHFVLNIHVEKKINFNWCSKIKVHVYVCNKRLNVKTLKLRNIMLIIIIL